MEIKERIQRDIDDIAQFGYVNMTAVFNTLIAAREMIENLESKISKSENELGDSGVTGEHGDLHDVALSHTHGESTETPVERLLSSITQAKEVCICGHEAVRDNYGNIICLDRDCNTWKTD